MTEAGTIRAELHCHTSASPDSILPPKSLIDLAAERGLDRVAITDHNTIDGALEAAALDPTRVIVGEEVMTRGGELLGYFLHETVPAGLPPMEAIARLRAQSAFISVAHPFDYARKGSWSKDDLNEILPHVDAIEVFNSRTLTSGPNQAAVAFAQGAGCLGTAGSDAHSRFEVGMAVVHMPPFNNAEEMRQSLSRAQITARLSSPFIHLTSRWAVWRKASGWTA